MSCCTPCFLVAVYSNVWNEVNFDYEQIFPYGIVSSLIYKLVKLRYKSLFTYIF